MERIVRLAFVCLMVFAPFGRADVPAGNSAPPGLFTLLDSGKQAVIVYNPDDGAYHGAAQGVIFTLKAHEDLANYLKKATGNDFTTVADATYKPQPGSFTIYVGNCAATREILGAQLAKLDRDGYIVRVEPQRVFLAGPMVHSTCWAVQRFLEDNLGVRWLFPGDLGTDVPHADTVIVPTGQKIEQPVILSRLWSGAQKAPGGVEWSFRQRIFYSSDPKSTKGRYEFQHNMANIFPPDKYYDQHPEYYALIKGVREREGYSHGVNICLSNPETIKIAARVAIDYLKSHPLIESYSFGPNDGGHWCECDNCKKLMLPASKWQKPDPRDELLFVWGGKMRASRLYWDWLSKVAVIVAQECPGKRLGTLSYDGYTVPPVLNPEVKVDPNILPYICFAQGDMWHAVNKRHVDWLIDQWSQRVKSFGIYDYAYGSGEVLPRLYTPLVQQVVREAVPKGLKGCYAEVYPNWGADGPRLSQVAKVWWNPNVDLDADLEDWCRHAFEEAAAPMAEHFRRCEREWIASGQDKYNTRKRPGSVGAFGKTYQFMQGWRTTPMEVFTPALIAEHTALFDEAARVVKDKTAKARIAWFRKAWDVGLIFADAYWAGEGLETYIARGVTVQQAAAALKKMAPSYEEAAWKKVFDDRMKPDMVAWYPLGGADLKQINIKPVRDEDLRWCARQVVDDQRRLYKEKKIANPPIAEAVRKTIAVLFEAGMEQANDNYKKAVEKIHAMAGEELK